MELAEDENEVITVGAGDEPETPETEQTEMVADTPEAEQDDVVVSIGEESPPPEEQTRAPEWVRELRKSHRELQRRNRELEEKVKVTAPAAPVVGKKPTLEELDYDAERYEAALGSWYDAKRRADEAEAKAREAQQAQERAWQAKLEGYGKAKAELRVRDFEDAEGVAQEVFSVTQQGVMLQGAENPALVIYALGKNPTRAKELASITDPVKFAFAVAKLEAQLKVTQRKAPPAPERTVRGTAPVSGAVDSTLERLRAEAARTGDMSKVMRYRQQMKSAKK